MRGQLSAARLLDTVCALVFASWESLHSQLTAPTRLRALQVRIDHRSKTMHFEGARLRGDRMAGHLSTVAMRLAACQTQIAPEAHAKAQAAQRTAVRPSQRSFVCFSPPFSRRFFPCMFVSL